MDLEKLEYVLAVAKRKSFTEAANDLYLSQSSVSKHVGRVEKELGVKIFDRSTRNVALTTAGEEFVKYAERIVRDYKEMKLVMRKYEDVKHGRLMIASNTLMIGTMGLASLIGSFCRRYPGIEIRIQEGNTEKLVELLLDGKADVGVISICVDLKSGSKTIDLESYPALAAHPVMEDEFALVVSSRHPLAGKKAVRVAELCDEEFILFDASPGVYDLLVRACQNAGLEPNVIFRSSQIDTILGLVADGLGLTFLTPSVSRNFAGVSMLRTDTSIVRRTVIAALNRAPMPRVIAAFLAHAADWKRLSTPGGGVQVSARQA